MDTSPQIVQHVRDGFIRHLARGSTGRRGEMIVIPYGRINQVAMASCQPRPVGSDDDLLSIRWKPREDFVHLEMNFTPVSILGFRRNTSINDRTNEQDTANMNAGAWWWKTATGREQIRMKPRNRRYAK